MREIDEIWTVINFKEKKQNFNSSLIWHNSLIRIENRPIFYKSWFSAGVKEITDILEEDNKESFQKGNTISVTSRNIREILILKIIKF